MTEESISPLRRRMIEDMSVRHFASKTQHDYIRAVVNLAKFLGRSPGAATNEDLRRFQLHLTENGAGTPLVNSTVSALRFFFTVTLDRPDAARHLTVVHQPRKLPAVLSPEEVARLLEAAPGVKYKAALSVAYGAGLRVSEVVSLKVSDIDSKRMMLRVERGSRLIACDSAGVAFRYKDYRADGLARQKVMRLAIGEFIRRFLIHVLPTGFHRIRHYGLFASGVRSQNIARVRALLAASTPRDQDKRADPDNRPEPRTLDRPCPCCGGRMIVVERFERGRAPRPSSPGQIRIDTS